MKNPGVPNGQSLPSPNSVICMVDLALGLKWADCPWPRVTAWLCSTSTCTISASCLFSSCLEDEELVEGLWILLFFVIVLFTSFYIVQLALRGRTSHEICTCKWFPPLSHSRSSAIHAVAFCHQEWSWWLFQQILMIVSTALYDCFNTVKWKVPTNHWVQYSRQCPLIHTVGDNKCKWTTGRHSESVQYGESPEGTH